MMIHGRLHGNKTFCEITILIQTCTKTKKKFIFPFSSLTQNSKYNIWQLVLYSEHCFQIHFSSAKKTANYFYQHK